MGNNKYTINAVATCNWDLELITVTSIEENYFFEMQNGFIQSKIRGIDVLGAEIEISPEEIHDSIKTRIGDNTSFIITRELDVSIHPTRGEDKAAKISVDIMLRMLTKDVNDIIDNYLDGYSDDDAFNNFMNTFNL